MVLKSPAMQCTESKRCFDASLVFFRMETERMFSVKGRRNIHSFW